MWAGCTSELLTFFGSGCSSGNAGTSEKQFMQIKASFLCPLGFLNCMLAFDSSVLLTALVFIKFMWHCRIRQPSLRNWLFPGMWSPGAISGPCAESFMTSYFFLVHSVRLVMTKISLTFYIRWLHLTAIVQAIKFLYIRNLFKFYFSTDISNARDRKSVV